MPRFSIVIPIYGRVGLFRWTLASLEAQRFTDWEAIIVDDGSNDPEVTAFLAAAEASDARIRTFAYPENAGQSAARNYGIERASGDYIAFLDTDDLYLPWTLELLNSVIEVENEPSFIAGSAVAIRGDEQTSTAEETPLSYTKFRDFIEYRATTANWWFAPSGVAIKANLLKGVGGFWTFRGYFEDIDLWFRVGADPGFVWIDKPVTYAYRLHDANAHHDHLRMYAGLERMIELEKVGRRYPGGMRRKERISSMAAHARHHAFEFSVDDPALGWKAYAKSWSWNLELGRWKFLLGFPPIALFRQLRGLFRARRPVER